VNFLVQVGNQLLSPSQLSRRPNRQFQHPAQCRQVGISWPNAIALPEIDARLADTGLFCDFGNRQATLDPSVAEMSAETKLAGQCSDPTVWKVTA
jgi:hypothetical protein